MPPRTVIERIRNIGIVAHVDAGKTTCTERLLFLSGKVHTPGGVDEGTTVTDFDPSEQKHGITIRSASAGFSWTPKTGSHAGVPHRIQLIDTPGHVDFALEVERSLRVLDGAVFLLDGKNGVECQTEAVWHRADAHRIPRIVFVNKMDAVGADFHASAESLRERLGADIAIVQLPLGDESAHVGAIDLLSMTAHVFEEDGSRGRTDRTTSIPDARLDEATRARRLLVEVCADHDEAVLDAWLKGTDPTENELERALRKATIERALVPVLCGSAYKNKGIPLLLDAIVKFLPAPSDVPPIAGIDPETEEAIARAPDANAPLSAIVIKTTHARHGRMTLLRVYSGTLRPKTAVLCPSRQSQERILRLFEVFGADAEPIEEATAGAIVSVSGLRDAKMGDTLCDPGKPIVFEGISFPEPVIEAALEPKTAKDRDALLAMLPRVLDDDPSLSVSLDEETGRTVLGGMGLLQLDIVCENLARDGISVTLGRPTVRYAETVTAEASADYLHSKQTGGPGQYARVAISIAPGARGSGMTFIDEIKGGVISKPFVSAVEKGIRNAAGRGVRTHNPLVDFIVRLTDGATHQQDSSALAFEACATFALREAARAARPRVLEPIMALEIVVPNQFVGDTIGDLSSRNGTVREVLPGKVSTIISAVAPLRALFGYVPDLRNRTGGRGSATLNPSHYDLVPRNVEEELLQKP